MRIGCTFKLGILGKKGHIHPGELPIGPELLELEFCPQLPTEIENIGNFMGFGRTFDLGMTVFVVLTLPGLKARGFSVHGEPNGFTLPEPL